MAVHAINKQNTTYEIPVLSPPITLQPAGEDGSVVNVTSEIRGLAEEEYAQLQAEQVAGKIVFVKASTDVDIETGALSVLSDTNVVDDSKTPRASKVTPASAVYFDSVGQPQKTILVDGANGACELEFWGSIDTSVEAMASKRFKFLGQMYISDPGLFSIPADIKGKMSTYRFIKIDAVRGASPEILFQSSS